MALIVQALAPEGFGVDLEAPLASGTSVWLRLPGVTGLTAQVVWREGSRHGREVLAAISAVSYDAAMRAAQAAMAAG